MGTMAVNRSRGIAITLHFKLKPHDAVTFLVTCINSHSPYAVCGKDLA